MKTFYLTSVHGNFKDKAYNRSACVKMTNYGCNDEVMKKNIWLCVFHRNCFQSTSIAASKYTQVSEFKKVHHSHSSSLLNQFRIGTLYFAIHRFCRCFMLKRNWSKIFEPKQSSASAEILYQHSAYLWFKLT